MKTFAEVILKFREYIYGDMEYMTIRREYKCFLSKAKQNSNKKSLISFRYNPVQLYLGTILYNNIILMHSHAYHKVKPMFKKYFQYKLQKQSRNS